MLILSRQSHFSAVSACARLDERLLDVDQTTFSTEIAPVLNSETFQGTFDECDVGVTVAAHVDVVQEFEQRRGESAV